METHKMVTYGVTFCVWNKVFCPTNFFGYLSWYKTGWTPSTCPLLPSKRTTPVITSRVYVLRTYTKIFSTRPLRRTSYWQPPVGDEGTPVDVWEERVRHRSTQGTGYPPTKQVHVLSNLLSFQFRDFVKSRVLPPLLDPFLRSKERKPLRWRLDTKR